MIISRTPLRISFVGGGSDLQAFYRDQPGAVVSTAIDKYIYVSVTRRFDHTVRVSYTRTEIVETVENLQHELAREALRLAGLSGGVEIVTIADVPAGTGLGSSSSVTVGLLNAIYAYREKFRSAEQLAHDACRIEIDTLHKPIGKQDQYSAAFGDLNYMEFHADETVVVRPVICAAETRRLLQQRLMTFFTGIRGDAADILTEQQADTRREDKKEVLAEMVELARQLRDALQQNDLSGFGALLHRNWELKKRMNTRISNPQVDAWYHAARRAGAQGGKILGAGGGGFLLLYCEEDSQEAVRQAMTAFGLREFPMSFDRQGSRIIYVG
jgi:D-glycero-alpha-D-manno-heptose-7-phosphate kinase